MEARPTGGSAARDVRSLTERFVRDYPFPLDPFQQRANDGLAAGRSVLVCAPTGAGKTVVGEFGVWLALQRGRKAFYTTPLKALSNQKFGDFIAHHGADRVGLLTGDNSINGEAPVVVMTTEVLRNMLYEGSPTLDGLGLVVMDEVHYLQDAYRGATWEEVLIHLSEDVQVAALSATVSNATQFGAWLTSVRGPTDVVVERERPVPIEHSYMVGPTLHPMFVRTKDRLVPNPALRQLGHDEPRDRRRRPGRGGRRPRAQGRRKRYRPDRVEVVDRVEEEGFLPAIVFIFSRVGCDAAVQRCVEGGVRLTDDDERERIREYVEMRAGVLPERDLAVLGFEQWREALERGVAAHHAGLIPLFKETVEELFERALVKVVFATETLALGINMPARSVVIERLIKFTGERHELMTPTDFTQLTGRAGRRGIDDIGFGVVLWQPDVPFERVAQLAEGRSFPLRSSFRPSYNMAVNLLRHHAVDEAIRLLNLSFGQYLIDRSVVKQQERIERNERFLASYRKNATCERGDIDEYWRIAREVRRAERERTKAVRRDRGARIRDAFAALGRGDVVIVERGPRSGLAAVVEVRSGKHGDAQPLALLEDRRLARLAVRDFKEPPGVVGRIEIPRGNPRQPSVKHQVAQQLESLEPREPRPVVTEARPAPERRAQGRMRNHPVHDCPDRGEHERWMERIDQLEAETASLRRRVGARTGSLARTFEGVIAVLQAFGYLRDDTVTEKGGRLGRIYNESDLLLAEAVEGGVLADLSPPELAAVVSTVVYETRIGVPEERFETAATSDAYRSVKKLFRRIAAAEREQGLELVGEPDPGFCVPIHRWVTGQDLEDLLDLTELSPGDFVRSAKQVWDLLRQLEDLELDPTFTSRCKEASRAIFRGVVASSGIL